MTIPGVGDTMQSPISRLLTKQITTTSANTNERAVATFFDYPETELDSDYTNKSMVATLPGYPETELDSDSETHASDASALTPGRALGYDPGLAQIGMTWAAPRSRRE